MRIFLASIPLDNTRVVVIGGGEAALAKLRLFADSPAQVLWFAPEGLPEATSMPRCGPVPVARNPDADDLAGARLVAHQAGWRPKARLQGWLGLFLLARIAKTYERSLAQAMPPLPPAPRESWPPAPEISREPLPLRDERGTLPDHL